MHAGRYGETPLQRLKHGTSVARVLEQQAQEYVVLGLMRPHANREAFLGVEGGRGMYEAGVTAFGQTAA